MVELKKLSQVQLTSDLAACVKQKRVDSGLTLSEVAAYLQISVETLVLYEEGKQTIPLHHVYGLSNCLNISADQIFRCMSPRKL